MYFDFVVFVYARSDSLHIKSVFAKIFHCRYRRLTDAAPVPVDQDAAELGAPGIDFRHENKSTAKFTLVTFDARASYPAISKIFSAYFQTDLYNEFTGMGLAVHGIEYFELFHSRRPWRNHRFTSPVSADR